MAERIKMAETNVAQPSQVEGAIANRVSINTPLSDQERLGVASQLLKTQLTPAQQEGLLKAHYEAVGEQGKDKGPAGIGNYTQEQVARKVKILQEAGFTTEQRRTLLESGIAGVLPPAEFAGFDPATFADARLRRIAEQIRAIGDTGRADEEFMTRTAARVERLVDDGAVDETQAQQLLSNLEGWRMAALQPPDTLIRIEQETNPGSFVRAMRLYEYSSSIHPPTQPEIQNLRIEIQNLVQQADQAKILEDVRKRALEFYKQVKATKRYEKWGRDKQQVIDQARRGYEESFWDHSPQLKQLESNFRGIARYVWDGIVAEVEKEVNGEVSPSLNVVAEAEFNRLKEQRRLDRLKEKKYVTHEYYGARNWELTAENAGELIPSALDWVRDQIAELSDSDVNTINRQIETIRDTGVKILETCRVRLEAEENQDISETNPYFLRAKALVEAVTDVLGNERVIYKGGEELGPQYKERFASNFIGHHDAIYLENPKVAYILHKLTTHRDGTYWLGQPFDTEKYSEGEISDYRRMIEEEIAEDAATHDLFIRQEHFDKRNVFGFDDNIERLLLDPGDQIRQQIEATGDTEALHRHKLRVGVFRRIKARLDQEDKLTGSTAQRQNQIRAIIIQRMQDKTESSYLVGRSKADIVGLQAAQQAGDVATYDRILWKWVHDYNEYRVKMRLPRWYPSGWDKVRIRIDRPTKVLDRALLQEEVAAMFEPIDLPQTYSYEDVDTRRHMDDTRFGLQLARSYQIFMMQDALLGGMRTRLVDLTTGQYTGRLPDDEASRLLGLIDQNDNVTNPERKIVRIFDIVQARLEAAISQEAVEINQAKAAKAQAIASSDQGAIRQTTKVLRDKLVDAQFLATHALKEIDLVEGKLPVWSYNFLDEAILDVFMKALADYGVEVAPGIPISHNNKKEFYEIMERGRRALKAEYDRAAQEHMAGRYPVFELNPNGTIRLNAQGMPVRAGSLFRAADDFGQPEDMSERYRMINKGAVAENRRIVDTRFETSTSGGVAIPEMISSMGDLGFYPPLVLLGVTDIRELHGYIHRRDEVEFHHQKFFDVMDPVQHPRAQAAAYIARRYLVGGKVGDKIVPGFLQEPFHGAFKAADFLHEQAELVRSYNMEYTYQYLQVMSRYRDSGMEYSEFLKEWPGDDITLRDGYTKLKLTGQDLEKLRQTSYLDLEKMSKPMIDNFYTTDYGVLDYFQDYLKSLKAVVANRRGRAPRNWEEEATLRWYAFRREMRQAMTRPEPEKGFVIRLGYAPEVASEISIGMMEVVLADADYIILRQYERDRRAQDGEEILSKALTVDQKKRGYIIPDEKVWPNQPEKIRKALETIRRRGLLEFMREEGYIMYELDDQGKRKLDEKTKKPIKLKILGEKIPPLVQQKKVSDDTARRTLSRYATA